MGRSAPATADRSPPGGGRGASLLRGGCRWDVPGSSPQGVLATWVFVLLGGVLAGRATVVSVEGDVGATVTVRG